VTGQREKPVDHVVIVELAQGGPVLVGHPGAVRLQIPAHAV
jgi:hypothetical protein